MKRIFLSFMLLASIAFSSKTNAQCNPNSEVIKYTSGAAPIKIGGTTVAATNDTANVKDWRDHIVGQYSGILQSPYKFPVSPGNIQLDGAGSYDFRTDRDAQNADGTQKNGTYSTTRDLLYFAFTMDQANVYFYSRRMTNNAQVAFVYFMDINADGFMRTGEPVIHINLNSTPTIQMAYYEEANTGTNNNPKNAAGWVSGKGDPMTNPINGLADGYNMPGKIIFNSTQTPVVQPALRTVNGINEQFSVAMTENFWGVEFSVPFSYLKSYLGTVMPALDINKIFTWHVSLQNGNSSDASTFLDNAGGCCAGLAVSGKAQIEAQEPNIVPLANALTQFRAKVGYTDIAGIETHTLLNEIYFTDITLGAGYNVDLTKFSIAVSADNNNDGIPDAGSTKSYVYNAFGVNKYISTDAPQRIIIPQLATRQFIIDVDFKQVGIKSYTINFGTSSSIPFTGSCGVENATFTNNKSASVTTTLPVTLTSFTATRNAGKVSLVWETASEENNRGFHLQRNVDGEWKNIAFIFSKAERGNASSLLSYSYNDNNSHKGMSQYRLLQVDIDGKGKYSEIRSVRGEESGSKLSIFPNPSHDGKVNILFEDGTASKDVIVSDITGRVIKQYRSIKSNNLVVDGLTDGYYTVQVINNTTATTAVEEIIVKKR